MSKSSLEALIKEKGAIVPTLCNSKLGIYVYPVVAAEFSSWRDEQRAWRDSAVRVRVSQTPCAREARENYAESWRTKQHG